MENAKLIKEQFEILVDTVASMQNQPSRKIEILDRELSGNKINGGKITNFSSVGILDESHHTTTLFVHDDGIIVENAQIQNITNSFNVQGDLTVAGKISAEKLHVNEISADVRLERTTPLEFKASKGSLTGKGIIWTGLDYTKQFVYKDPGLFFCTEDLELAKDRCIRIDNVPVLNRNKLGPTIVESNLQKLGVISELKTSGNLNIDNFIFYDGNNERLGIGTDAPNAAISVKSFDHEFIIDDDDSKGFNIGAWSNASVKIVTDNTPRIEITQSGKVFVKNHMVVEGKMSIGVKNFQEDVDITTNGPVRLQNKKFEVADDIPKTGNYIKGDIVWNSDPKPTGYVGWICIRNGAPGEWKAFGTIQP